jgi:rhamnose utilization protein RhaD (predicted bifunctional aldolase and dehydrogenase)
MHALLGRFVLHSHPITVNIVACQPDWRNTLNSLFPGSALIGYNTPGIDTALALMASLERQKLSVDEKPFVVFLQNHGMIVSAETCDEVIEITNQVVRLLEAHLNVDFADYRTVSSIAETVNKISNHPQICYLSQDKKIYELIMNKPNLLFSEPICPDMVVYNGSCPLEIENLQDPQPILEHMARKNELPRIILYEGKVFFMAPNVKKAQAMESVLKFHLLVMNNVNGEVMCLENSEIAYILNWEAEKYRKEL